MDYESYGELIRLNQEVLESIIHQDWETYVRLTDPSLTCFEPETRGHLVEGLDFHRFYFDSPPIGQTTRATIAGAHVRQLGADAAIVSYVRLMQRRGAAAGETVTSRLQETRVWQKGPQGWKQVHLHRSCLD